MNPFRIDYSSYDAVCGLAEYLFQKNKIPQYVVQIIGRDTFSVSSAPCSFHQVLKVFK